MLLIRAALLENSQWNIIPYCPSLFSWNLKIIDVSLHKTLGSARRDLIY
jgi:hypothetical protein